MAALKLLSINQGGTAITSPLWGGVFLCIECQLYA